MYITKIDLSIETGNEIAFLILAPASLTEEPEDTKPGKPDTYVKKISRSLSNI